MVSVNHLESFMPRHVTHVNKHDMGHDRRPIPPPRASPLVAGRDQFPQKLRILGGSTSSGWSQDWSITRSPDQLRLPPHSGCALRSPVAHSSSSRRVARIVPSVSSYRRWLKIVSPSLRRVLHRLFVWTMQAGAHSLKGCLSS
ncbi:hypothetical protein CcrC2_gp456c [Caulobacter phage C2]|nr:hypothetical protein CcrC2_gp456c [Caulobacter phage C2]